jgi:hypothetical protein
VCRGRPTATPQGQITFSCSRRSFCPSCAAKRAAIFGSLLREEVVEEVSHCLRTFTVPKLHRPYFLHHRPLLGKLCRAAWTEGAGQVVCRSRPARRSGPLPAEVRWDVLVFATARAISESLELPAQVRLLGACWGLHLVND